MSLFKHREAPKPPSLPEGFEPVVRSSICTGERVACMRDRESGRLHEIELVRTDEELAAFCRRCGADGAGGAPHAGRGRTRERGAVPRRDRLCGGGCAPTGSESGTLRGVTAAIV